MTHEGINDPSSGRFTGPIMTNSEMSPDTPPIKQAFNYLNIQIDELRGDLETLYGAIAPVLGPAKTRPHNGSPNGTREDGSELTRGIFEIGDMLRNMRERAQDIHSMVEF